MSLSILLKQLRERQRLRVADVAAMLEVSKSSVYAWESGENEPAPAQLLQLANAYSATKKDRAEIARLKAFGPDEAVSSD